MVRQIQPNVGQNFLAGMTGGLQAGQQIRQANDQNALRNIFATQDVSDPAVQQQIMQYNPQLGMQMQNQAAQRERQQMLDARAEQSFDMQMEDRIAQLSAQERAEAQQTLTQGLMQGNQMYQQGDLNGLNQLLQSAEMPPIGSLEEWPGVVSGVKPVMDALERLQDFNEGPKPADEYGRYVQEEFDAGRTPLSRIDYKKAGQKTTQTRVGPDGSVEIVEGFGGSKPKKLSEKQSQLTLFGSMMDKTMPVINSIEDSFDPANLKDNLAARAGWGGNYFKSQDMQKYESAGRAWAEGVLRLQTGAAATQPEIERVFSTYFAQPGDTPETVQYKRELRTAFAESVGAASGGLISPGADTATPEAPATAPQITMTPDQQSAFDKYSREGS